MICPVHVVPFGNLLAFETNLIYFVDNVNNVYKTDIANKRRMRYEEESSQQRELVVKEQVSFRIAAEVKEVLEQIASSEHRTIANLTEKLVLERLRDMGLLDELFQTIKKKA